MSTVEILATDGLAALLDGMRFKTGGVEFKIAFVNA